MGNDYESLDVGTLWNLATEELDQKAIEELLRRFEPLVRSESWVHGRYDEDVAQDIRETFVRAIYQLHDKSSK